MKHGDKFTHDGKQYTYYAPDKPVIFDPPIEALVWDDSDGPEHDGELTVDIIFYDRRPKAFRAIGIKTAWEHMAIPAPDNSDELMTHEELAELLAYGYGMFISSKYIYSHAWFGEFAQKQNVHDSWTIKRFRSDKWIKPTKRVYREFMAEIGRPVN